ncbi:D-tagatose-bisphosphate aldolase, class II, non-catalytic subunit [Streptomyces sp. J2-1]|uniref:D-tagatose-bisphosphate aldolase, class II, non-catalytic subunit n=1 Tax=Streptomyces corallincola TaxID=2851888 RepID=UPI001C3878EC|nr:D-tagatose-bisphosphate aldolase, class II, non-catalytic subunit [Streptomyces corallincola]MBV2352811.1 D-tagatose-bisphosphate aldolase, class II, non-catalytic subunit [Streptomyces corallincola]
MWNPLDEVVRGQKAGRPHGVTSVCSAHPLVIEAAVRQALSSGGLLLVEATSNQVDQYGGYTGMRPEDFRELVLGIAAEHGLPQERIVLGGDHLGPNRWRSLPPEQAMAEADALVAAYVRAGFTKIHLDCSFPCVGDPAPLTDDLVAERTARLVRVAEETAGPAALGLRYVIGTEVPVPGGAHETLEGMAATTPGAALLTLRRHRDAFAAHRVDDVWPRVLALVVQPGVEFDHLQVFDYRPERTAELREVLADEPHMVFEAHSTDYQTAEGLAALVAHHWAVLKVGPGLTFALREALFALAAVEDELLGPEERSGIVEVVDRRMREDPSRWQGYYNGDTARQRLARRYSYSYSDRVRYYWPDPEITAAQERLFANLVAVGIPLPLLSAHLPDQYRRVRAGALEATPRALVVDHIRDVLRDYDRACRVPDKEYV